MSASASWAYLIGIFIGGVADAQIGMKRSVLISLILMGCLQWASFALLAMAGHTNLGLAVMLCCFENMASGIGGVVVVAYFSAPDGPALHRFPICGAHRPRRASSAGS